MGGDPLVGHDSLLVQLTANKPKHVYNKDTVKTRSDKSDYVLLALQKQCTYVAIVS